ncbi:MAG: c-type cytochrome [Candidatus Acidiferrales bacterium]
MPTEREGSKNQSGVFWIFLLFLVVAASGAAFLYYKSDWRVPAEAKKMQNPVPANRQAIGAGMMTYMDRCQGCHGENGDGKGEKAAKLSVAPANFTDPQVMSRVTDGELFWKITHGRRPMPSFKDKLTDEERWQVVDYIRTFAPNPSAGGLAKP